MTGLLNRVLNYIANYINGKTYTGYKPSINVTSYSSTSNLFEAPGDGILSAVANVRAGQYAQIKTPAGDVLAQAASPTSATLAGVISVPLQVQKGTKYYFTCTSYSAVYFAEFITK